MEKSFSRRSNPWSACGKRESWYDTRENKPISCRQDRTMSCMSLSFVSLLFMFWLGSHIITCQTAGSNKPDEQPTLFKLPLHALHLRLVATHAVQSLRIEPWGERKAAGKKGGVGWGAQWGNKQSANTSLALLQTDTTKQMLAVSGGVLNLVYPCINFTSHGDNEQVRFLQGI